MARGNPSHARDSGLFLYISSYAPLGEGGHTSGELFFLDLFGGLFVATPSRQPPFRQVNLCFVGNLEPRLETTVYRPLVACTEVPKIRCKHPKGPETPVSGHSGHEHKSGRTKHAPNCGYRFVSPLPPFSRRGICRFPVPENALFLREVILFLQNLLYESTVFPNQERGGKR